MEIQNYTEVMVENLFEVVLNRYPDICKCEKCMLDIKAISLNKLPPRYIVTEKGELYKKMEELDNQIRADVIGVITSAVEQVRVNTRHK